MKTEKKIIFVSGMHGLVLLCLLLAGGVVFAGDVEIVKTEFSKRGDSWHVSTTLKHDDTGWKHYADAWRVVDENGKELGTRTLFHPHENEQPFTRSLSGIKIPASSRIVFVEAHDKKHGWSKQRVRVDLSKRSGERFEIR